MAFNVKNITPLIETHNLINSLAHNINYIDLLHHCSQLTMAVDSVIDNKLFVKEILKSNNTDKIKLILSFSKAISHEEMLNFIDDKEMRLNLVTNQRLNWYVPRHSNDLKEKISRLILNASINENLEEFRESFFANPRMDRQFISEIVRGQNEFSKLEEAERFHIGIKSLQSKYTDDTETYYYGKDPTSNELYFHAPIESVVWLIKKLIDDGNWESISVFSYELITRLYVFNGCHLFREDDWLPNDNQTKSFEEAEKLLTLAVIEWVRDLSKNIDLDSDDELQINLGSILILLTRKAITNHYMNTKEFHYGLMNDNSWIVKAASISVLFDKLTDTGRVNFDKKECEEFAFSISRGGLALKLRGLVLSKNFWLNENQFNFKKPHPLLERRGDYKSDIENLGNPLLISHLEDLEIYFLNTLERPYEKDLETKSIESKINEMYSKFDYVTNGLESVKKNIFWYACIFFVITVFYF